MRKWRCLKKGTLRICLKLHIHCAYTAPFKNAAPRVDCHSSSGEPITRNDSSSRATRKRCQERGDWGRTTCAVTNQGDVVCWGVGRHGQLGNAELEKGWETPYSASPVPIKGLSDISEVTVSDEHVCALHRKGYPEGFIVGGVMGRRNRGRGDIANANTVSGSGAGVYPNELLFEQPASQVLVNFSMRITQTVRPRSWRRTRCRASARASRGHRL